MRDMELCRKIMLAAVNGNRNSVIDGYTDDVIKYNQRLLIDKGYLKGSVLKNSDKDTDIPANVYVKEVTWEGHDFIDAIADESNWSKVKGFLKEGGKQITIDTIAVAVQTLFRFGAAA
ncbi:DUF2513 domain-containing protein [Thiobacillus sp.]